MFVSDSAESLRSRQPGIDDLRQMAWCCKTERKGPGGRTERQKTRKRREEEKEMEERSGAGNRGDVETGVYVVFTTSGEM